MYINFVDFSSACCGTNQLASHPYYCFVDGYSGYNQIAIAPEDQEKPLLHVLMEPLLSEGCQLDCVILQVHYKDA